jgi:hypothetical protein
MVRDIEITIKQLEIEVKPVYQDNLLAFANITYKDDQGNKLISIRGFRIRKCRNYISVDFPGYPTHSNEYQKSFILNSKIDWLNMVNLILEEFHNVTGGQYKLEQQSEYVNPDEIPDFR